MQTFISLLPGSAKVLFIIVLLIPVNPANVSQGGHLTVLPPDALKGTRLLCVGMELSEKDDRPYSTFQHNREEHTHTQTLHFQNYNLFH